MSGGIHLIYNNISGYGPSNGRCLPGLEVPGRAVVALPYSRGYFQYFPQINITSLKCSIHAFKGGSFAGTASSSSYRRNPDVSRQNKNGGFFRNRNRQNQERENSENLEESELLSSKNGPLFSLSSNPRFQATSTPGPREQEIVKLFKKVQAQLRERAAIKEEKKIETSKGQGRESETVDSLLKLLRKHSFGQGKRRNSGGSSSSRDFVMDQPEQNNPYDEEQNTTFSNSTNVVSDEAQEYSTPSFTRPASNFRRKSPVPRVKYKPIYSTEDGTTLFSDSKPRETQPETNTEPEREPEPVFYDGHEEVYNEITESESPDNDEAYKNEVAEEQLSTEETDLSALKLTELKVLAKTRGVKGFSKLKKSELVEVLRRGSL